MNKALAGSRSSGSCFYTKGAVNIVKFLRLLIRIRKFLGNGKTNGENVYVADRTGFYKKMWENASTKLGVRLETISDDFWQIRKESRKVRINNYKVPLDDPVTLSLAGEKALCYRLLSQVDIPIPEYAVYTIANIDEGIRFLTSKGGPFVVKPSSGTSAARGVSVGIRNYRDFIWATALASLYGNRIIIEKMIAGELYRLLFLENKMIHAARRTGIRVRGDGTSSLALLIERTLMKDKGKPIQKNTLMKKDKDLQNTLNYQHLSIENVPMAGQQVLVKSLPIGDRGDPESIARYTENVTEQLCPNIIETARKAVVKLGIIFAGVDLITTDPTAPLGDVGGAVIEVNSTPGLHHHYNLKNQPVEKQPAEIVLKYLLSENSRI